MQYMFDRICSPNEESQGSSGSVGSSLERSVTRELARITSQRQYFAGFEYRRAKETKPDILAFGITRGIGETFNSQTGKALTFEIKRAILAYEPRLLSPLVSLRTNSKTGGLPEIVISGYLQVDGQVTEYQRHFSTLGED